MNTKTLLPMLCGAAMFVGSLGIGAPAQANPAAVPVMVEIGKQVGPRAFGAVKSLLSSHPTIHPYGNAYTIPIYDYDGSRATPNFSKQPFNLREGRLVRLEIINVPEQYRSQLRFQVKADKPGRPDRNRSEIVGHGSEFRLYDGTSGDRNYYFAERGLDAKSILARWPDAAIKLTILR